MSWQSLSLLGPPLLTVSGASPEWFCLHAVCKCRPICLKVSCLCFCSKTAQGSNTLLLKWRVQSASECFHAA